MSTNLNPRRQPVTIAGSLIATVAFGAFIAMAGCKTNKVGGDPQTETDEVVNDIAQAVCDWARGCCNIQELADFLNINDDNDGLDLAYKARSDEALCHELATAALAPMQRRLVAGELAGRIDLPTTARDACMEYFKTGITNCALGYDSRDVTQDPCSQDSLAEGLVQKGELCSWDFECAGDLICRAEGTFGICDDPAGEVEPCGAGIECGPGLYCSPLGVAFCTPADGANANCDNTDDCAADSFCDDVTRLCTTRRAGGESCGRNEACASGICNQATGTCAAGAALTEPCSRDAECGVGAYCDYSAADEQVCVSSLAAQIGERCDPSGVRCDDTGVCENGLCVPKSPADGWCDGDGYCPDGQICVNNTCTDRAAIGEACSNNRDCVADAFCNNGADKCEARAGLGASCADKDCVANTFCHPTSVECTARASEGDSCSNTPCDTGLACAEATGICRAGIVTGDTCVRGGTCEDGAYCADPAPGASDVCLAALVLSQGADCVPDDRDARCGDGLFCDANWNGGVGTCEFILAPGDGCNTNLFYPGCAAGDYCSWNFDECLTIPTTGEECPDSYCASGNYCDGTFCVAQVGAGVPCTWDVQCEPGTTCEYDDIDMRDECFALPTLNEPCDWAGRCNVGLGCDGTNTCVVPVVNPLTPQGQACDFTSECEMNTYCGPQRLCTATRAEGSLCEGGFQCDSGLICEAEGVCRPEVAIGGGCDPNSGNGLDVCEGISVCDPDTATCVMLDLGRAAGEPCSQNFECASGRCIDGLCVAYCTGTF